MKKTQPVKDPLFAATPQLPKTMWFAATQLCGLQLRDYVVICYIWPENYAVCSYGTVWLSATPDISHPIDSLTFSAFFGALGRALGF